MSWQDDIYSGSEWIEYPDLEWLPEKVYRDLASIIAAHDPENLLAYIRGFAFRGLSATITSIYGQDLLASIFAIAPENLSAYLKVWPMERLVASIRGWQEADLNAFVNMIHPAVLPATIGVHNPGNIKALIKGWVREATSDLSAFVYSATWEDLGGIVRATYLAHLPAYLFPVQPIDISASIYGWGSKNLQAIINATAYPWDLTASIVGTDWKSRDLLSTIISSWGGPSADLSAYILTTQGRDNLPAALWAQQARDLSAFIDPGKDLDNLNASIYPKKIRLTGILSLITMEHHDLSATISIPCFYSNLKDLTAYIRPVYQSNLSAQIYAKDFAWGTNNLGASFGYALDTVVQDKLQLNINIAPIGFRTEDKFNITMAVFRAGLNLTAAITGTFPPADLSAAITGVDISPYDFETWKGQERVVDRTYSQTLIDYENVVIEFSTIVKDYFYSSGSDVVAKVNKYEHFLTKISSYYSPATGRKLEKQLHKVKYLYGIKQFGTTDEAMKYAIWYVTTYPEQNLSASINALNPYTVDNLSARLKVTKHTSINNNLTSYINGTATHSYDVVIGYTDDGVGYLQF